MRKDRTLNIKNQCILAVLKKSGPMFSLDIADALGETDLHLLRQNLRDLLRLKLVDRKEIREGFRRPRLLYSIGSGSNERVDRTPEELDELMKRSVRRAEAKEPYDDSTVGPNGGRMIRFGHKVRPSDAGQLHDYMPRRMSAILGE